LPSTLVHFEDVETLSLVRNGITHVPPDYFKRFKRLRRLYLDHNAIAYVAPHFLRGTPSGLKTVSMQDNDLKSLSPFSFGEVHDVGDISLRKNRIRVVRSFAFAGSSKINMLMLGGNPIQRLEEWAFTGAHVMNNETLRKKKNRFKKRRRKRTLSMIKFHIDFFFSS
jgi:Leucine-rich repeat (LRR) protein